MRRDRQEGRYMEQLKTDTQETKKKVLGGNTSGNLLNYLILCAQPRRNRSNQTIRLRSNCGQTCGQKIFGISGGAKVVGKRSILPRKCKK